MCDRVYDLEERLLDFAVQVCALALSLKRNALGKHVSTQLIRSGTSPAANYAEAQSAESSKDFRHKMKICLKELRESFVWLELARRMRLSSDGACSAALSECDQLIRIFRKSVATANSR